MPFAIKVFKIASSFLIDIFWINLDKEEEDSPSLMSMLMIGENHQSLQQHNSRMLEINPVQLN